MPKLPTYDSQRDLITKPSTAPMSDAGTLEGKVTQQAGQALGQASQATFKWAEAVDTMQATTAETNFKTGLLDIMNRADNDTDINAAPKYQKEIADLKQKSLEGLTNPANRQRVGSQLEYAGMAGSIQVDNKFKKKQIDNTRAAAMVWIDAEVNNPTADSDSNIAGFLDGLVQQGIYSKVEAQNLESAASKDIKMNKFLQMKNTDLEETQRMLDKGEFGFDISTTEKAQNILDAEFKNQKTQKKTDITILSNNLTQKAMQVQMGEADKNEVIKEIFSAMDATKEVHITDELARTLFNMINKPKLEITEPEKYKLQYADFVDKILEPGTDLENLKMEMANVLTVNDFQSLYNKPLVASNVGKASMAQLLSMPEAGTSWWEAGWNGIKEFVKKNSIPALNAIDMYKSFINNIGDNTDQEKTAEIAAGVIKEQNKRTNPQIISYSSKGQMMIDANNNVAIVYPDGTIEEVE